MKQEPVPHKAGSGSALGRAFHMDGDTSQTLSNCSEFGTSLLKFVQPFYFPVLGMDKTMV